MFTILFFVVAGYLMVGMLIARHRFAIESRRTDTFEQREKRAALKSVQDELNSLSHSAYCNLNFDAIKRHDCDCAQRPRWKVLSGEEFDLRSKILQPKSPYLTMTLWPFGFLDDFLRGGYAAPPVVDKELVARLERELNIGEH